jgi:hypothetical protein
MDEEDEHKQTAEELHEQLGYGEPFRKTMLIE